MAQDICPQCITEDDPNPRPVTYRGMCRKHYQRARRQGTLAPAYRKREPGAICESPSCTRPVKARGLCPSHYARAYRGVSSTDAPLRERFGPTCSFDGCDRPHSGHGLCGGHAWQQRQGRELTPIRERFTPGSPCSVEGCDRAAANLGLCATHYDRHRRGEANWDRLLRPKAKNGTGWITKQGYRMVRHNGRAIAEHRLMAEQVLGRPLLGKRQEDVHHVNTNRLDNWTDGPFRLNDRGNLVSGNLEIWAVGRQPRGGEVGPQLDAAVGLLETYGEFLTDAQRQRLESARQRWL